MNIPPDPIVLRNDLAALLARHRSEPHIPLTAEELQVRNDREADESKRRVEREAELAAKYEYEQSLVPELLRELRDLAPSVERNAKLARMCRNAEILSDNYGNLEWLWNMAVYFAKKKGLTERQKEITDSLYDKICRYYY